MSKNPKLVSFDRSAAYMHHRAMMNRRDNNLVDALELMRRAVEASPENREYKLDLAELYCDIGCHAQSSRLLLDLLAEENPPSECYYALAINQLGMNDVTGAAASLNRYRDREPEGERLEDVQQLSAEIDLYTSVSRPASRRLFRAQRIADRACDALKEEEADKACRLFERSLKLASEQYEMRALYALALLTAGDRDAARAQAKAACEGYPPSVRALCVSAQVHAMLGERAEAEALIARAEAERPQGQELRLLLYALGEMRMDAQVAEYARLALQETPYDRALLHMRAVALKRTGAQDDQVAPFWARILRIDPEDSVAQFYVDVASRNELDRWTLDYAYQVPRGEFAARLRALMEDIGKGYESIQAAWATDGAFRSRVRWAVEADEARMGRVAMTVLATVEGDEAQSLLRALLFNPEIAPELKLHAALMVKLQGQALDQLLPAGWTLGEGLLPDPEPLMERMPVGDRQLIRYSADVLEELCGRNALPALTLMWSGYRRSRGTQSDPILSMEGAAAALAYNYLLAYGPKPRHPSALARAFGCAPRQMFYYARRIAGVLEKMGETTQDEDP